MDTRERLKLIDEINSHNEERIREWNKQLMAEVKRRAELEVENLGNLADAFGTHRKALVELLIANLRDLDAANEGEE